MNASEIKALDRLLDRMDYYRLLRVERSANASEIRAAYHRIRRDLHPDAYLAEEPEVQLALDRIARRLNEAYVVLRDAMRRPRYDRDLADGVLRYSVDADSRAAQSNETQGRTTNGKRFYALMVEHERKGDYAHALANLKMALTFEPQNETFKQKLEELQAKAGPAPKAGAKAGSPYTIR
jgi:DnaJ-class molecular chaperone